LSFGNSLAGYGVRACWLVGAVFVVLKLTDVIKWSWWWVTAPVWMALAVSVGVGLFETGRDAINAAHE
jgi:hypothetical protein